MSKARQQADSIEETPVRETGEVRRPSHIAMKPVGPDARRERFELAAARRAALADEGVLEPPGSEELLSVVLELNRTVSVEMLDDAIVHRYVSALRELSPRRRFCVRLLSPEGGLTLVYATAPIEDGARSRIVLSEEALSRHELREEEVRALGVEISPAYVSIFAEPGPGFDIPLIAGGALAGVMSVEYEAGLDEPPFDRTLIVPLAVQLGAALRNARLLRESRGLRDQLEKLLDHANAPIAVIGTERELRVVNRAFLQLTESQRERLLGRDFLTLLPETERARILPVLVRAFRGEPTSNFELRLERESGGHARLLINTASIRGVGGEVEGVIAIGRDLTELRELEEQIIQAEKLATLGQLAAGVVHELNNPLTSISVYGEFLLKKGEREGYDPADIEKLRRIVENTERILRFTRDLVTYARPSTEEPAFVPIGEVIEQSLLFCEHVIHEARAKVTTHFDDRFACVYAVRGQLHQVFINVITNACQALSPEGGEIVLATHCDENELLHITVEDNGSGIPESLRAKIFEPFYSTKDEGKGTGLGLSIVRNIVEQHGGAIDVRSRPGGGTIFEIRLPGHPAAPR